MEVRETRLSIAKKDIIKHFEGLPTRVFTRTQIDNILSEQRYFGDWASQ